MMPRELAQTLVEQSAVLLKNEKSLLPLEAGTMIAVFGRAQVKTVFSGNGSGASQGQGTAILDVLEKAGLAVMPAMAEFYRRQGEADTRKPAIDWEMIAKTGNSGLAYEMFGQYQPPAEEYDVPDPLMREARGYTDTAILVLGRDSGGEECDRHLEDDYYLTASEKRLVEQVCSTFPRVAVVLNINGLVDLVWTEKYPAVQSILFLGVCGEMGGSALANILTGKVNPSGRLAFTIARRYEDYPSAKHFTWSKEDPDKLLTYESYGLSAAENGSSGFAKNPVTVYQEGIYNGYRYFDSFEVEPLYPFGFGLSYTTFPVFPWGLRKEKDGLHVNAGIQNVGSWCGAGVIQLYLSASGTRHERPAKELKGVFKTKTLTPAMSAGTEFIVPWKELACYDEERAAWVIEPGRYEFWICNSTDRMTEAGAARVEREILVEQCANRLELRPCNRNKLRFLSRGSDRRDRQLSGDLLLAPEDVVAAEPSIPAPVRIPDGLAAEQLAALCVGYGPGIPFSAFSKEEYPNTICGAGGAPLTVNDHPTGALGYVSPAIPERGIHSVYYKDGPSGIGEVAWPTEMLIACAFDPELWKAFGCAIRKECEKQQVNVWLAPAVNLHRNPLCGRNFEYFSEDPYLTGACACAIAEGVQRKHTVLACPKHFAANEQETFRRGSGKRNYDAVDSIMTERTLRELYLKPFEMLVRQAHIACIMTSFNKINGTLSGGNTDLCTGILREEWGFDGAVVTDWGDMDTVVDGADAVAAGNDIVMPGGPPVIAQILKGYHEGRVTREQLESAAAHLLTMTEQVHQ